MAIVNEFVKYLENLFEGPRSQDDLAQEIKDWVEPMLTVTENHITHLNREFTKEEVKEAMKSMKALTSPGPDGIPPIFIQKEWDTCGNEMSKAALDFLA